jgi:hypothetical protein
MSYLGDFERKLERFSQAAEAGHERDRDDHHEHA